MENLEQQQRIISLGKLLVKELKLEPGVDTISRWMAHYIAEKISLVETSEGSIKNDAEKECFDIILKLWQHRHSMPSGNRPLQNFEPILQTLSKLNPDKEDQCYYFPPNNRDLIQPNGGLPGNTSVNEWVDLIKLIDTTARIWIEYALNKAVDNANDEQTNQWLTASSGLSNNGDRDIINSLLDKNLFVDFDDQNDEFSKKYEIERLNKRLSELSKFSELNAFLITSYQEELRELLE